MPRQLRSRTIQTSPQKLKIVAPENSKEILKSTKIKKTKVKKPKSETANPELIYTPFPANPEHKFLYKMDNLIPGIITQRPSKVIRSPYVADVILKSEAEEILESSMDSTDSSEIKSSATTYQLHTPSLGTLGLSEPGSEILMFANPNKNAKCHYRTFLSVQREKNHKYQVCIRPDSAEKIVEICLKNSYIHSLENLKSLKKQVTMKKGTEHESRFDFTGLDENDHQFILEVKYVPIASYLNMDHKFQDKIDFSDATKYPWDQKIALFPSGPINKQTGTISERALKHIRAMKTIQQEKNQAGDKFRTIICYVVQREDAATLEISNWDTIYHKAVDKALKTGVEKIVLFCKWTADGEGYLIRQEHSSRKNASESSEDDESD